MIRGFKFAGVSAGIKGGGGKDLALISAAGPVPAAGVFTTSAVKAAPVILDMERIGRGRAGAVIINSGNANACTGSGGLEDAREVARAVAGKLGMDEEDILVLSTGVIGQRLPMERLLSALPHLVSSLSESGIGDAAEAMMTTDSFPKISSLTRKVGDREVTVAGVAKGAGMIAPNMATMLACIMTDAEVDQGTLSLALKDAVEESFNCITVDGDMSTNDTVLALASGACGLRVERNAPFYGPFLSMMKEVAVDLAKMIVRDGEGATKLVEIRVKGARSREEARRASLKIANSPLVKTAFYGEDPNWGRIAAAVGSAGVEMEESKLELYFDDVLLVADGVCTGDEAEKAAKRVMGKDEILLTVDLGVGTEEAVVWTCDLTHDYIRINAEYRT